MLDGSAAEVEFQFKNDIKSHDYLHVYVLEADSDDEDIEDEDTLHASIKIKDYFGNGEKLAYGKSYDTNMVLYDEGDKEFFEGTFGENEVEGKGEHPYISTSVSLSEFTYEVAEKVKDKKPKASRASRSPPRARAAEAKAKDEELFADIPTIDV